MRYIFDVIGLIILIPLMGLFSVVYSFYFLLFVAKVTFSESMNNFKTNSNKI